MRSLWELFWSTEQPQLIYICKVASAPTMVAKSQQNSKPQNRKQISGNKSSSHGSASKKPKFVNDKHSKSHGLGTVGKPFKSKVEKSEAKKEPITKREHRLQAKVCQFGSIICLFP